MHRRDASDPARERPPLRFTPTVWPGAAASAPPAPRSAPRRYGPFTRLQWLAAVAGAGGGLLGAAALVVLFARWLVTVPPVREFLVAYPGAYSLPADAPTGFPAWIGWQHFFNTFLIVLIIRSGLQIRRDKRPKVFWSPRGAKRRKMSLSLWFHQALDVLWIANGAAFVILLVASGHWMRIVPTSWEVLPHAVSAGLQYASLNWPTEHSWAHYNSLQQLSYFVVVFVASPLAVVTGLRLSYLWPRETTTLNRLFSFDVARRAHVTVMVFFVAFIVVHVALVFATGALRNLNRMYAGQDAADETGLWIFLVSLAVLAAGWIGARPRVLIPVARLFGTVRER